MPQRRRTAVVLAATVAVVLGAVSCDAGSGGASKQPSTSPTSTPLSELDTSTITVARGEFCSRVAPAAVHDALGGDPRSADDYGNGDRAQVVPGVRDVVHEFGCTWTGSDGTLARAWVFAPPVTRGEARQLRPDAVADGCRRIRGAPAYGDPSAAVSCRSRGRTSAAFHGLFGDAWLSCSIDAPRRHDARLTSRVERWCVTVVQAAAA